MFSRDNLPNRISKECGIVILDSKIGSGTLWICYRNIDNYCEYFASWYMYTQIPVNKWKTNYIYSGDEIQERDSVLCGYRCLYHLLGRSMLETIQNSKCDFSDQSENHKFITNYFKNIKLIYIMVKSYCVKQKKVKKCVPGSEHFVKAKNGTLISV